MAQATVTVTDASGMQPLDLIASLAHSLAWPVIALLILWSFRKEVVDLLRRLRRASAFGIDADFDETAKEVQAGVIASFDLEPSTNASRARAFLYELSDALPTRVGQIVREWGIIERWLRSRVGPDGLNLTPSTTQLIDAALRRAFLSPEQAQSLRGLYSMRNLAVHGRADEIDERRLREFMTLALAIRVLLQIPNET